MTKKNTPINPSLIQCFRLYVNSSDPNVNPSSVFQNGSAYNISIEIGDTGRGAHIYMIQVSSWPTIP